jgi:hypothetical protein
MRYEIQWFPKGPKTKYNIGKLYKAVIAQAEVRDVEKMPTVNYNEWSKPTFPEAVQFTVTGSYPYDVVAGVNDYLMAATKSPEPQGLSVRAVSTIERKKSTSSKPKRKICRCK